MEKRYQVFLSSTYSDLQEERKKVIESIMQMDSIPAGMEIFPASDDEQFEFIKKVIDDCDYYILIIGGRYGSESYEGISYTEKEYDYAYSKNIPILVFVHGEPENIPFGKTEQDVEKRKKLNDFKDKVSSNRLIKYWKSKDELPGLVALSLSKAIKMYPQVGWIRGSNSDNKDLLEQINKLRIEKEVSQIIIQQLENKVKEYSIKVEDLAQGEDVIKLNGTYKKRSHPTYYSNWKNEITWDKLFSLFGPFLFEANNYLKAKSNLQSCLKTEFGHSEDYDFSLDDNLFQIIKIQFFALKLIDVYTCQSTSAGVIEFIQITNKGKEYLVRIKSIKKNDISENASK